MGGCHSKWLPARLCVLCATELRRLSAMKRRRLDAIKENSVGRHPRTASNVIMVTRVCELPVYETLTSPWHIAGASSIDRTATGLIFIVFRDVTFHVEGCHPFFDGNIRQRQVLTLSISVAFIYTAFSSGHTHPLSNSLSNTTHFTEEVSPSIKCRWVFLASSFLRCVSSD